MRFTNSNEPYLANKETEKRDRAIEKRDRVIAEMDAKLKKLEALLKAYDNSNTPSSKKLSTTKKKRSSNGAKVLQELLSGWNGIIVCDGWSAYSKYRIQRCWAHLIREPRHLSEANPDNIDARNVLAWLRRIYADAKKKRLAKARQKAHVT